MEKLIKNFSFSTWAKLFFSIFSIGFILFFIFASKSYCGNTKTSNECIEVVGVVKIPMNILPNLIGSFAGAVFTFCAYYLLEETKRKALPKPIIEVSFEPDSELTTDKFRDLVVKCEPHYVYWEDQKKNISIGNACYLRVKITNKGNIVGKNCRAYLKKIYKKTANDGWVQLEGYEDSMPLLWAYERKEDYYIAGLGRDLPSQASDYADILVSYESYIAFQILENPNQNPTSLNKWFLKLKTKRQVPQHARLLEINLDSQSAFKFTVEVYADECLPSKIDIILSHEEKSEIIQVYDDKNRDQKAEFTLYQDSELNIKLAQFNINIEQIIEQIYELL